MTEEQFETLVNLIRTLADEAVDDARPGHDRRCDNSADIAATIAYARSQFQDEDASMTDESLLRQLSRDAND